MGRYTRMLRRVKTLAFGVVLFALLAAPAHAEPKGEVRPVTQGITDAGHLAESEALRKARLVLHGFRLAAFADSYKLRDCARQSRRTIACQYAFSFNGRIPDCEDTITLTTRWTRGERYIGWTVGKDALDCSAGLDVAAVEVVP